MKTILKGLLTGLPLAMLLSGAQAKSPSPEQGPAVQAPPGIGVVLTLDGLIFVDANGMTLYRQREQFPCTDRREAVLLQSTLEGKGDFVANAPDLDKRRSCIEKHPPLVAAADAKPVGKWTIINRPDGSRQWAYANNPLYRSIKDKKAGDVNGMGGGVNGAMYGYKPEWIPVDAPFGAPSSIKLHPTALGLALADSAGKTLYYADSKDPAPSALWLPVAASEVAAEKLADWSIVTHRDGSKQWAYKGKPLYRYARDSVGERVIPFGDTFGSPWGKAIAGWHVAVIKKAPPVPAGVTVQEVSDDLLQYNIKKKIYADATGKGIYLLDCIEDTADRLECDDPGDTERYWLSICGGAERCATIWHPVVAPAEAKAEAPWSIVTIDPRHPWQIPAPDSKQVRAWAYRGRVLFTYAFDQKPGDTNAAVDYFRTSSISTTHVLAYATEDTAHAR